MDLNKKYRMNLMPKDTLIALFERINPDYIFTSFRKVHGVFIYIFAFLIEKNIIKNSETYLKKLKATGVDFFSFNEQFGLQKVKIGYLYTDIDSKKETEAFVGELSVPLIDGSFYEVKRGFQVNYTTIDHFCTIKNNSETVKAWIDVESNHDVLYWKDREIVVIDKILEQNHHVLFCQEKDIEQIKKEVEMIDASDIITRYLGVFSLDSPLD